ncbi:uncharacterized protein LOC141606826 [Silene latifolia]|uniref:uncharacterized protein LOC141606826 n=1 Tax=Silene latifolia TaxID=37657 RepID=UPI003D779EF2
MNQSNRNVMTSTRKRKDRGGIDDSSFYTHRGSFVNNKKPQFPHHQPHNKNIITTPIGYKNSNTNSNINTKLPPGSGRLVREPGSGSGPSTSNQILAGYMAHEFLTKGTLFGHKFDPARAEAVPVSAAEPMRKPAVEPVMVKSNRSYNEVARLLKGDGGGGGTHIPGIFNPTQLARWIQM